MNFPNDFRKQSHPIITGATQWTYPKKGDVKISVVGGGNGLYGNGITTFEMWDFREENPQGHMSADQINEHLKNNPI